MLFSFDHTNQNNILLYYYNVVSDSAYLDSLTSIQVYNNVTYLGTNDELYRYYGSENGMITELALNDSVSMSGRDYVTDVTQIDADYAWICQKGYTSDNVRLYNSTTKDLSDELVLNPCESVHYEDTEDL